MTRKIAKTKRPTVQISDLSTDEPSYGQFSLGYRILDRYEIFQIHPGGMGTVYIVIDIENQEKLAVKTFIPPETKARRERMVQDFINEVEIWLNLPVHNHIAKPYLVEIINDQPYLFMEYVSDGEHSNLRDLIGHLNIHQAVNLAYQICRAMEFVNRNQRKIVHADLKPENILITPNGTAKVTDFGAAKPFNFTEGEFPRQQTGSLPYMPPEQLRGEIVDQQSDIFSYGVMLYEMLTGDLPYPFEIKKNSSELRKQLEEFYDNMGQAFFIDEVRFSPWTVSFENKDLDYELIHIIIGCMFPNRDNRWRNFRELRQHMEVKLKDVIDKLEDEIATADLHRMALSLYRIGSLSDALSTFNLALRKDPNNSELWRDAALALIDAGMHPTAYEFITRAKKLDPEITIEEPT